jgi:hypothetical protein
MQTLGTQTLGTQTLGMQTLGMQTLGMQTLGTQTFDCDRATISRTGLKTDHQPNRTVTASQRHRHRDPRNPSIVGAGRSSEPDTPPLYHRMLGSSNARLPQSPSDRM